MTKDKLIDGMYVKTRTYSIFSVEKGMLKCIDGCLVDQDYYIPKNAVIGLDTYSDDLKNTFSHDLDILEVSYKMDFKKCVWIRPITHRLDDYIYVRDNDNRVNARCFVYTPYSTKEGSLIYHICYRINKVNDKDVEHYSSICNGEVRDLRDLLHASIVKEHIYDNFKLKNYNAETNFKNGMTDYYNKELMKHFSVNTFFTNDTVELECLYKLDYKA